MKAHVIREACNGCGLCPEMCPEYFALDADGLAVAGEQSVPSELQEACRHAADNCPVEAIHLSSGA